MKKYLPLLLVCFLALPLLSIAKNDADEETVRIGQEFHHNNVKMNLMALGLTNFSFQYERALSRKFSVCMGLRLQPTTNLPFRNYIRDHADRNQLDSVGLNFLNRAKINNWAFTPEVRYYFGKKPLNGFYVAPYCRVSYYGLTWGYLFNDNANVGHSLDFRGEARSFTFGLLLGCQWHISKTVLLDWWMIGPAFGSANFSANANGELSQVSQQDRDKLEADLNNAFNSVGNSFNVSSHTTVSDKGVKITGDAPFGGVRTGLCLGISF